MEKKNKKKNNIKPQSFLSKAVADFCKISIDTNVDEGAKKITLTLG